MAKVRRMVRIVSGFALLGLGVIGLFLPILQGVAMIVAGLLLLAPDFPLARRLLNWLKHKFQRFRQAVSSATKANQ